MIPLVLNFSDFKKLVKNQRIYYFEGEEFVDLHFIVEAVMVKSRVLKINIENPTQFFSDRIFVGATRLLFNIPIMELNPNSTLDEVTRLLPALDLISLQDEETKKTDIQEEEKDEDG